MNTLVLACLLYIVCSALGSLGSEVTFSPGLSRAGGGPASGDGLIQTSPSEDEELEVDEDPSGGEDESFPIAELHFHKDERRRRKSKGRRKNKQRSKSTTAFNPEHLLHTGGYTSSRTTAADPCTSTHLGYCVHGLCKYMEGLQEPVCVCLKGFDGERCGIQTLEIIRHGEDEDAGRSEVVQTVLVIIAVVLSVISCIAILLMTCAHYRSHKNFLAAYLGRGTETEKLQKPVGNIIV